jgi:TM2 domain-containing membrane protein YozV
MAQNAYSLSVTVICYLVGGIFGLHHFYLRRYVARLLLLLLFMFARSVYATSICDGTCCGLIISFPV